MDKIKKIPKKFLVLAGLLAAIYIAWDTAYPHGTMRYKMTVTVETPEGIKTGFAVREVSMRRYPQILPEQHGGEASVPAWCS
jgi:hypothetical protein